MSETFECESCGGTFPKGRTDEEARAEAVDIFGTALSDPPAIVCDDCWRAAMAWGANRALAAADRDQRHAEIVAFIVRWEPNPAAIDTLRSIDSAFTRLVLAEQLGELP